MMDKFFEAMEEIGVRIIHKIMDVLKMPYVISHKVFDDVHDADEYYDELILSGFEETQVDYKYRIAYAWYIVDVYSRAKKV